ncbi:AI-2E family transporter [Candidatus Woesearchaeota archaeon]|nr:AI-2E family transporter [Candidatus Woesearchaeota archaeon]
MKSSINFAIEGGKVGNIRLVIRYSVIFFVISLLLTVLIMSSLIKTVLAGLILSYVFYPIYKLVLSRLKSRTVSGLLVTMLVLLLLTVPSVFVINQLSTEVFAGYIITKQYVEGGSKAIECEDGALCKLLPHNLKEASPKVKAVLNDAIGKASTFVFNRLTQTLLSVTSILLHLFIVFFIMYYMFKDGKELVDKVKNVLPLPKHRQDAFTSQFNKVVSAVVYGTVVVALVQGILGGVGFFLFGVPSPVIWGLVTFMAALVPFLGPFVIWLPAALLLMFSGYSSGDGTVFLRGLGLFLYGMLLVSGIDNVLKPSLISAKAKVHPALVLLGVIGGLNFFGIIGLIVGPVIMAMLATSFDAYLKEKAQPASPA